MKLFLRYMCDHRYVEILQEELELIGEIHGVAELKDHELDISPEVKYTVMHIALVKYFSERSNTSKSLLFEEIKKVVSEAIKGDVYGPPHIKYATYLSEKLHHTYPYLSTLFSKMNGTTLENYIISQRVELVKQMLVKEGLGLSEIAWKLGYCSVPHLSNQFKKITGSTPSCYKSMTQEDLMSFGILCEPCKQRWMAFLER